MADYLEQARLLDEKIRKIIGIFKYSRTEIVTGFLSILCFSAATLGLGNLKDLPHLEIIRYGLLAVGAILLAWTVFRIWKQAIPPELPPPETRPAAIKGPMPFTREDAELFRGLGRRAELETLLAYVLDEQIPLVGVMGESGVGKTSLLRAGLSSGLAQRNIRMVYWEALPNNPKERLLHAIQASWDTGTDGTQPTNIDQAIKALSAGSRRTVIVLDQFEQLNPDNPVHRELFEILRIFATSGMSPYRLTWVVAFRREYDPQWRDFELSVPGLHPPMLSLRLFEKRSAREIMAALAAASDFTLDDDLTADVIDAAASRDGRVSPVDIGVGMLVLSGLAIQKNKRHLNKEDYRFAGGAEGILTAYITDRLERFGEAERQGVMKALLALANLDNDQRIAEGKTVDELSPAAQLSPTRLRASLEYLATPQVRLLETILTAANGTQKYRLPHDRIVPSLRRLTGLVLAETDQARLILENAFRSWLNGRRERFLLAGADLKKILNNRIQLYGGALEGEKTTFLKLSLQKRFQRRLISGGFLVGLAALAIYSWQEYQNIQAKRDLSQSGLPEDLYDHQSQLLDLQLTSPIPNLEWLHTNRLQRLSVYSAALRSAKGTPPSLVHLILRISKITSLAELEKLQQLTTLDLSYNYYIRNLAGLEELQQLTTLNLSYDRPQSLAELEKLQLLTTLDLSNNPFLSLAGLEKLQQLTTLNLSNDLLRSLAGLEKLQRLTTLDLSGNGLHSVAELEKLQQLTTLNLSNNRSLQSLAGLEKLRQLAALNLSGNGLQSLAVLEKLQQLTTLDLSENGLRSLAGLEKLQQLTTLNLSNNRSLQSLAGLEKLQQLTTLDLSNNRSLQSLAELEKLQQLTTLNLSGNDLQSLAGLEKLQQLTTLDLSANGLQSLAGLEKLQQLTTLNLYANRLQSLAGLEKLQQLTTLDLSGNGFQSLAGLETLQQLTTLSLSWNKGFRSLAGARLEKLQYVEDLDLSYCDIESLKPIAGLKKLKNLNLQGTKSSLEGLPASVTVLKLGD
jgi:Leucine-rich repeat (LRR) protein